MSSQDWKRTKTAGRMPMRRSLEEQSELIEDLKQPLTLSRAAVDAAHQAPTRPLTPDLEQVPIIATWSGELSRVPERLEPSQVRAIETLAALCALLGEAAGEGEVIEVEARAGGSALSAVALDRSFVFMDYLSPGTSKEMLRLRAHRELELLRGSR